MVPTSLLAVSASLPLQLQQYPRLVQLVNDFLQPRTIDTAVYQDLQRVIRAHASSRPCTGPALDFAAAHGQLGVLRVSRSTRRGRCSAAALTGAAANGHLDVVKWLSKKLRRVKNRHLYLNDALRAAAMNGRVEVANFLRKRCSQPAITLALKLAAGCNHVSVVKLLLPWVLASPDSQCHDIPEAKARTRWPSRTVWGTLLPGCVAVHDVPVLEAAFKAAAANGHIETVEFLLKTKSSYGPTDVTSALEDAMSNGHFGVVRLLMKSENPCSTTFALVRAASTGDVQAAKLLVDRSDRNAVIRAACVAMGKSIALQQQQQPHHQYDQVVELLLRRGSLGKEARKAFSDTVARVYQREAFRESRLGPGI